MTDVEAMVAVMAEEDGKRAVGGGAAGGPELAALEKRVGACEEADQLMQTTLATYQKEVPKTAAAAVKVRPRLSAPASAPGHA